jgi:hypothetical protein
MAIGHGLLSAEHLLVCIPPTPRRNGSVVNTKHVTISLLLWAAVAGCTEAPLSSDEIGQNLQALCANGDGVNSAMAALAVSTARELKRWQPSTDFTISSGRLALSSTGKTQCSDGVCWNTQTILDLQKAPLGSVKFGNVTFNADNFKSRLVAELGEQKTCEARPGNQQGNCNAEAHKLTFKSQQPGACDTIWTFEATSPTGAPLLAPAQLKNKLIYVGYPENPYLGFGSSGATVSIDPTYGLNEGGTTTAGSCSPACAKVSSSDITDSCCDCPGATQRKYARSTFSTSLYLCK